ncbi:MAG: outer membrane beta-barrel protein [Bacteroidales bacterium]|nr:outer membrane beta-barrel protein [Bacteroidales bacterium]
MKRAILIILISIFPIYVFSQERKLNFYPNIAVDLGGAIPFPLSDIPDGSGGTPKPYPSLGIGSEYNLNEKWQLAFEINYHLIAFSATANVVSQPFYYNDGSALYFTGHTETDIELRMVEFPLIAFYKLKEGRRFLFGAYYSRILEGRFETKGINGIYSPDKNITDNATLPGPEYTIEYNFNKYIDKYDYGVLIGYRYDINHRLYLWARLNVGFKSIFEGDFYNIDYDMYQVRINLGISYKLFD